jgi:hypothetical protein
MDLNGKGYLMLLGFFAMMMMSGLVLLGGCGNSYGVPYGFSDITPNDGGISLKLINTTSVEGGLRAPAHFATGVTDVTSPSSTLIKVYPDDVWISISDVSLYSTSGKEFVVFTEPKEFDLMNLLKDGEVMGLSSDTPIGDYNRMKFNINYIRLVDMGEKGRIGVDETVYLSTADSNLTQFSIDSGMRTTVTLNFDIVDKVFKDRNNNYRVFPSVFLIYQGKEAIIKNS